MNLLSVAAFALAVAATAASLGWCYRERTRIAHPRARLLALAAGVVWGIVTGIIARNVSLHDPAAWSPLVVLIVLCVWQVVGIREEIASPDTAED